MRVFENAVAQVDQGLLGGITFTFKATGRRVAPTPWMKQHMGQLHAALRKAGFDVTKGGPPAAAFWNHMIEIAASPPNGLLHAAVASQPLSEIVADLIGDMS